MHLHITEIPGCTSTVQSDINIVASQKNSSSNNLTNDDGLSKEGHLANYCINRCLLRKEDSHQGMGHANPHSKDPNIILGGVEEEHLSSTITPERAANEHEFQLSLKGNSFRC